MHIHFKKRAPLAADVGRYWILILLDINTAYDTINHAILLDCLHKWAQHLTGFESRAETLAD